ncbi:MAG: DUF1844 domain-containing protein [bacterium]|nr:DUF1844 domain-containing protein [bacterium]
MTEEKKGDQSKKYKGPPKVTEILQNYIVVLGTLSLHYMGHVPNPEGKLDISGKRELDQAKIAIDSMEALYKQIESLLDKQVKNNILNMIDDLKLRFADENSKNGKKQ